MDIRKIKTWIKGLFKRDNKPQIIEVYFYQDDLSGKPQPVTAQFGIGKKSRLAKELKKKASKP